MTYNYNQTVTCDHCGESVPGMGQEHHKSVCRANPANRHKIVVFYGDHTVYWEGEVFGPKELDALNVKTPAGGYVKLAKDCKSK